MSNFRYGNQALFASPEETFSAQDDAYALMLSALTSHCTLLTSALSKLATQADSLIKMALLLVQTLRSGRKVLLAGNGGSAAEAQHFAAELVGRFKRERAAYPAMALTTDTAILTALANDYGYQDIFARQVQAFGQPGDMLIVFSTSGESENLIRAVRMGRSSELTVAAIIGERRCRLADLTDLAIQVPSVETSATQELHMVVTHLLCEIVESCLYADECEKRASRM